MSKVLEVKELRVSFRTNNGNVKAVRGISFDLNEGETLAIVGDSGSGKSVTAKSIIGINAANTIVESGEIIYKGEDLLKYTEKEYNRIRGNDLTMVFQDPLSSLDPIMKVGKQMTEATLLNNRTKRKNARAELKTLRAALKTYMRQAGCTDAALTQENVAKAMQSSAEDALKARKAAAEAIERELPVFQRETLDEKEARAAVKRLTGPVKASIDPLALQRSSGAYTFVTSMNMNMDRYFTGLKNNPKEERRVARETAHREKILRAKKHAAKVRPANLIDLELAADNLRRTLTELLASCRAETPAESADVQAQASRLLVYMAEKEKEAATKVTRKEAYDKAIQIMKDVGIKEPEKRFNQYPHEFSGGMLQRALIAMALVCNPKLLIADEPTTALDVTIQAQILELMKELQKDFGMSILFITHDLGTVARMCDRVAVMYLGKIVETAPAVEIFKNPQHPYTRGLIGSVHKIGTKGQDKLFSIEGTVPVAMNLPKRCGFYDRCDKRIEGVCDKCDPELINSGENHKVACFACTGCPQADKCGAEGGKA